MAIAAETLLEIHVPSGDMAGDYIAYMRGPHRYGYRATVPVLLNQYRPLPAGTEIICCFTNDTARWRFDSHVLGYEEGGQPDMIIAPPVGVSTEERRHMYRLPVELPTLFWVEQPFWGEQTRTVDLSIGGVCCQTSKVLEHGLPVTTQIDFGGSRMSMRGQVAWSRYCGRVPHTGIRFGERSASEELALSRQLIALEVRMRESLLAAR